MGETIRLTAEDGHQFDAFLTGPEDAKAGLVVVQEIFGVNSHIRDVCERLAGHGHRVIAPALFDRAERGVELPYDEAGMTRGLDLRARIAPEASLSDLTAAAGALGVGRVGVIGFCWGGTLAFLAATRTHAFAAAVGWYGGGIADTASETPNIPVQLHFGGEDPMISHQDVTRIRDARPDVEVYVYDDAGHGFNCDQRGSYAPGAAKLAMERSLEFFAKNL